jgi:hypothetical protein
MNILTHREAGLACTFSTVRDNVLRTVGTGYLAPTEWESLEHWTAGEAQTLARMLDPNQNNLQATARGKVFFLGTHNGILTCCCYQVKKHDAQLVFCGNCTAAAMVMVSQILDQREFAIQYLCEGELITIEAHVRSAGGSAGGSAGNAWSVSQHYNMHGAVVGQQAMFDGHDAVFCSVLNPYLIINGPTQTDIEELLAKLYETSRTVNEKVAVVETASRAAGGIPKVTFYNCNGRHGAAPMTGVASLALMARQVGWLGESMAGGKIQTPSSIEKLPTIVSSSWQNQTHFAIEMPQTNVMLNTFRF